MGSIGDRLKRPPSISARAGHTYPGVSGERTANGSACAIHAAHPTLATTPVMMMATANRHSVRRSACTTRGSPPATRRACSRCHVTVQATRCVGDHRAVAVPSSCRGRRHADHGRLEGQRQRSPVDGQRAVLCSWSDTTEPPPSSRRITNVAVTNQLNAWINRRLQAGTGELDTHHGAGVTAAVSELFVVRAPQPLVQRNVHNQAAVRRQQPERVSAAGARRPGRAPRSPPRRARGPAGSPW